MGSPLSSSVLIRKLSGFYNVAPELRDDLCNLTRERVKLEAGESLLLAGDRFTGLFIVVHAFQIHVVSRWGVERWHFPLAAL